MTTQWTTGWCYIKANFKNQITQVLKSFYFKKTVARISILSKLCYFQYKLKQKVKESRFAQLSSENERTLFTCIDNICLFFSSKISEYLDISFLLLDVRKNPRAMAKLFKEAGRVKNVLSANNQIFAQVENVMDDIDFKIEVTRLEFETMNQGYFDR